MEEDHRLSVGRSRGRATIRRAWHRPARALVTAVAVLAVASCDAVTGSEREDEGGIYVRYIGSAAGVYDTYCFPVREEPEGRIVEIDRIRDVNIIDATYEYLPDGLRIQDPVSPVRYADCRDFDLIPAPPPTTAVTTTTLPPPTVPPATVPPTAPPATPAAASTSPVPTTTPTTPPTTPAPLPTIPLFTTTTIV